MFGHGAVHGVEVYVALAVVFDGLFQAASGDAEGNGETNYLDDGHEGEGRPEVPQDEPDRDFEDRDREAEQNAEDTDRADDHEASQTLVVDADEEV